MTDFDISFRSFMFSEFLKDVVVKMNIFFIAYFGIKSQYQKP